MRYDNNLEDARGPKNQLSALDSRTAGILAATVVTISAVFIFSPYFSFLPLMKSLVLINGKKTVCRDGVVTKSYAYDRCRKNAALRIARTTGINLKQIIQTASETR